MAKYAQRKKISFTVLIIIGLVIGFAIKKVAIGLIIGIVLGLLASGLVSGKRDDESVE
jgi:uncharacterized membrane protein (UPF0136 family)